MTPDNPYLGLMREGKPELWPQELWQLLAALLARASESAPTPRMSITATRCPDYASPLGNHHEDFNLGLHALAGDGILAIEWSSNGAAAKWVRLNASQQDVLERLVSEFGPLPTKSKKSPPDTGLEIEILERVVARYGSLGQRTAAHLGFGDSHYFDGCQLPTDCGGRIWTQADAKVEGANLVRLAGELTLETPSAVYCSTWDRPGHYIWEWELARCLPDRLQVGQKLLLIENPYPYWELLTICRNSSLTLLCLHGETLREHEARLGQALTVCLQKIYQAAPRLETWIWCDPDPSGLLIASNAYKLASSLGGAPLFWRMEAGVLAEIEGLVFASPGLRPITEKDRQLLRASEIHPELQPLAREIQGRGLKGEQEGLVLEVITDKTAQRS